jgi:hypothetical protein
MTHPRRILSAVLAAILVPVPASPQAHVVTADEVHARFATAAGDRADDIRMVETLLATPAAGEAARLLRADLGRVRAGVPSLTDAELRDLAARARQLTMDPVAGANPVIVVLVVIGALFVLLLIIGIIVCLGPGSCD